MEATFSTKAIILDRQSFRERDSKETVYSLDKGKLELVARGTRKISSKLAGHLEPITLSNLMIVKGRQFDYIGSAVSENCYPAVKSDLAKLQIVGQAINVFNQLIKSSQGDKNLFNLLQEFLDIINAKQKLILDFILFYHFFILKLLAQLGYKPQLYNCLVCQGEILPQNNIFNYARGGLICPQCSRSQHSLTISKNCIKILRLVVNKDLSNLINLKIDQRLNKEICKIISSFLNYNHQIMEG